MNIFLRFKDFVNGNISNNQLIIFATYGFCCNVYFIYKLLNKLSGPEVEPEVEHEIEHEIESDVEHEVESEIESEVEHEIESEVESEVDDPKDESYIPPKNYSIKLRKRRRGN